MVDGVTSDHCIAVELMTVHLVSKFSYRTWLVWLRLWWCDHDVEIQSVECVSLLAIKEDNKDNKAIPSNDLPWSSHSRQMFLSSCILYLIVECSSTTMPTALFISNLTDYEWSGILNSTHSHTAFSPNNTSPVITIIQNRHTLCTYQHTCNAVTWNANSPP